VLCTLNAGCLIDQDAQGLASTIQTVGKQAGIGLRSSGWQLASSWVR
jgi:hypothetical protein